MSGEREQRVVSAGAEGEAPNNEASFTVRRYNNICAGLVRAQESLSSFPSESELDEMREAIGPVLKEFVRSPDKDSYEKKRKTMVEWLETIAACGKEETTEKKIAATSLEIPFENIKRFIAQSQELEDKGIVFLRRLSSGEIMTEDDIIGFVGDAQVNIEIVEDFNPFLEQWAEKEAHIIDTVWNDPESVQRREQFAKEGHALLKKFDAAMQDIFSDIDESGITEAIQKKVETFSDEFLQNRGELPVGSVDMETMEYAVLKPYISHDASMIVGVVKGPLLLISGKDMRKEYRILIDMVKKNWNRYTMLVGEVYARAADVTRVQKEFVQPCTPDKVFAALESHFNEKSESTAYQHISFDVNIPPEMRTKQIVACEETLYARMVNLCNNPIKEPKFGASALRLSARVDESGKVLVVTIQDNGNGMSPEFMENKMYRPGGTTHTGGTVRGYGTAHTGTVFESQGIDFTTESTTKVDGVLVTTRYNNTDEPHVESVKPAARIGTTHTLRIPLAA